MRNLKESGAAMRSVKKEPVVIDLENVDEDVLCGKLNECRIDTKQTDTSVMSGEANSSNMQRLFCAAANESDDCGTKIDHPYMMLLDSLSEDGNSYLRDNPLRAIRYEVDNGGYDKREFKAVTTKQKSRDDGNTIRVTKKNVVSKPHVQASKKKTTRESPVSEKSDDAVLITSHVKRKAPHSVEAHKKGNPEEQMVPDESYRFYLKSLVEKSRNSRTNPEKEVQVKREEDAMSLSDSDIVAVDDRPFLDEEDSPFVPSKNYKVVDLEEESDDGDDQRSSWFRKEITNMLKQPYNEKEFLELKHEASVRRVSTRCWELRNGKEITYETGQKGPSYLHKYPKFKMMFKKSLREKDRHRALNLLRGFIFYLTKVARHDAFKPWLDRECLKITSF